MSSEELLKRKEEIFNNLNETSDYLEKGCLETMRVQNELENTRETLDDLDKKFMEETGLTSMDVTLLFLAIGLQMIRQYTFKNDRFRLTASQGDKLMENALSLAPPKWQDVLLQSVPYDAIRTGANVSETGLSGATHRYRTLGHDPLLGWIFGTANIMTNSLTTTELVTYQVNMNNMQIIRRYPSGVSGMLERAVSYGINDPTLFATAVARQAIHLGSDYFTKQGLPIPIIATINNDFAKNMIVKWHIDSYSVTRGAGLSFFINTLISLIHSLFFEGGDEMDKKLSKYKDEINKSDLSVHEIITLASVVELEGAKATDRKGVAGVFYNRLASSAYPTLGSDATTYYASKIDDWSYSLTYKELNDCKNKYNTRCSSNTGLPVGPICNPGIESIEATINPDKHEYYYFVADCNGKVYLTKNSTEHNNIINKLKKEDNWCA